MLTQVEMAQSIYDNRGFCNCRTGVGWNCSECPMEAACVGYVDNYAPTFNLSIQEACLLAAEEFLSNSKPTAQSYLNTKTRRKPAFKRLSSRKTYQPEEQTCLSRYFSPRQDKFV